MASGAPPPRSNSSHSANSRSAGGASATDEDGDEAMELESDRGAGVDDEVVMGDNTASSPLMSSASGSNRGRSEPASPALIPPPPHALARVRGSASHLPSPARRAEGSPSRPEHVVLRDEAPAPPPSSHSHPDEEGAMAPPPAPALATASASGSQTQMSSGGALAMQNPLLLSPRSALPQQQPLSSSVHSPTSPKSPGGTATAFRRHHRLTSGGGTITRGAGAGEGGSMGSSGGSTASSGNAVAQPQQAVSPLKGGGEALKTSNKVKRWLAGERTKQQHHQQQQQQQEQQQQQQQQHPHQSSQQHHTPQQHRDTESSQ